MRALPKLLILPTLLFFWLSPAAALPPPPPHWSPPAAGPADGPVLGVLASEIAFDQLDALGLDHGVGIARVIGGSPAARSGLQQGDILLEIDGQAVYSVARLRWLIGQLEPDHEFELTYTRDGEKQTARARLQSPDTSGGPAHSPQQDWTWASPGQLGVRLQSLTPGLREAFGVPPDTGALVAEVSPDSAADSAGLQAGDVIVRMDRRRIHRLDDVQRVIDYFGPGEPFDVEIIRNQQRQTLNVELDATSDADPDGGARRYPGPESLPFFAHPHWWRDMQRYLDQWRDYWEEAQDQGASEGRAL